ncbi:MAG: glutathione peroxidase [Ignavibacteriales bacterium]
MFKIVILILFVFTSGFNIIAQDNSNLSAKKNETQLENYIYDITVLDMNSQEIKLSDYAGKVLMIVNVASECGYTPHYEGLEEIYKEYNQKGFEILAFPCNDFGGQEPGTNEQIQNFCSSNYGVTFKLFDKVKIVGSEKSPLYEKLTTNSVTESGDVKWNFEKFLISKEGKIVARYRSKVEPTDQKVIASIEQELAK